MRHPLLKAQGLKKSYAMGRQKLDVLRGVSLTIRHGEFVAIMGSSGCGKSTLLHLLGALDIPDAGQVRLDDVDVFAMSHDQRDRLRNQTVGFIFQFYHLLPELTVLENVLLPCMVRFSIRRWFGQGKAMRRRAEEILDRVKLGDRLRHLPNELAGGERQRVAIARALINQPKLLLADEPTGNLDRRTGAEVLALLAELNQQGQTIIMVTHDLEVANQADRTLHLADGVLAPNMNPSCPVP